MADFYDQNEILGILQGFNPWWGGRIAPAPAFRRLAYHACRRFLDDPAMRRAVLLSGPRRVGKTTILIQVADALVREGREARGVFHVSLDHPLLRLVSIADILRLYHETVHPQGKSATLLLDEVHYAADWDLHIKQLIDRHPEYRIVATGSASVVQRARLSESGVGRWVRVPVPTLSFHEFLHLRGDDLPDVPGDLGLDDLFDRSQADLMDMGRRCRTLMPLFQRYLLVGGFPETARHTDMALSQRLLREDVIERVLKRDLGMLFGIRNVNDLEKLFVYLCLHSGGIFGVQTCATAMGVSATTVVNHLKALEQANLIYRLAPVESGGKKVLKARFKVYLADAALGNAVLLRGEEVLTNSGLMGPMVETTVLRHLHTYYYRDTPQVLYWRDARTKKEVDMIVKSARRILPVEVKYRGEAGLTPEDGLVVFCRQERVGTAYWITQRETDFDVVQIPGLATRFLRVPAHVFAYLIGQAERLLWTAS